MKSVVNHLGIFDSEINPDWTIEEKEKYYDDKTRDEIKAFKQFENV